MIYDLEKIDSSRIDKLTKNDLFLRFEIWIGLSAGRFVRINKEIQIWSNKVIIILSAIAFKRELWYNDKYKWPLCL